MTVNTIDPSPLKFRPHGDVTVEVYKEGIVLYKATGPFNEALIEEFADIENNLVKEFKQQFGRWCEVVIFERSCMILEAALQDFESHLQMLKEQQFIAQAAAFVIADEVEGKWLMPDKYRECYETVGVTFETFDKPEDAIKWAQSQLTV